MKNYTVAKDGLEWVIKDGFGYVLRRPEDADKILSLQLPIFFPTEQIAREAAANFQEAEQNRLDLQEDSTSQHSRERLDRMDAEGKRLTQAKEDRNNLACSTAKVRELTNEITDTEHSIRTLEASVSSLEGQLEIKIVELAASKTKLASLQDALRKAKGEVR